MSERICLVPSCGAVLKKNESGVCKGCDQTISTMGGGKPWLG
jgi:hypothetical protein